MYTIPHFGLNRLLQYNQYRVAQKPKQMSDGLATKSTPMQFILNTDKRVSSWIYDHFTHSKLGWAFDMHSGSADGRLLFPFPLLYGLYCYIMNIPIPIQWIQLFIGYTIVAAFELTIKSLVGRTRPELACNDKALFVKAENYSFPSGHSMRAVFIVCVLGIPFLYLWAIMVMISRVAVGRHYLGDCISGALFAVIVYEILYSSHIITIITQHFLLYIPIPLS